MDSPAGGRCAVDSATAPMRVYARARGLITLFPAAFLAASPVPSHALRGPRPRSCRRSRAHLLVATRRRHFHGHGLTVCRRRSAPRFRCCPATDSPSTFRLRVTERTRVRIPTSHQARSLPVRDVSTSLAYACQVMPDLRTPGFTPRARRTRPHVSDAHARRAHTPRTCSGPTFRIRRSGHLKMNQISFSVWATLRSAGQRLV